MYPLEVKRWLVFHKFPVTDGWNVIMDIDSMERGEKGRATRSWTKTRNSA